MRPFRSFLFLLIFLVCFAGLHYIIPSSANLPRVADLIPLLEDNNKPGKIPALPDTAFLNDDTPSAEPSDSRYIKEARSDRLMERGSFSEYILAFFDSLRSAGRQIRIMYYGDSQIEADRITSYLRKSLRAIYGGSGPGLFLPVMPVMYTKSIFIRSSANWKRYNYLSFRNGETDNTSLGPFMTVCRYLPVGAESGSDESAYIRISPSVFSDSTVSDYRTLRVFYGNVKGPIYLGVSGGGKKIAEDTLKMGSDINEFRCNLGSPDEIRIEFKGRTSPDIFGISIESDEGLILDNIPQRGSAGLEFTMVERMNLEESYRLLDPDLFILHYGLNIVKNQSGDYTYYERGLYRQLKLLKELRPETPVLLMSLTDMAYSDGDSIISYPDIERIRDAQKNAALLAGADFWDPRAAMGGEYSIVKWSERDPPLAQKDYVHFTNQGADTLSALLLKECFTFRDTVRQLVAFSPAISAGAAGSVKYAGNIEHAGNAERGLINKIISSALSYNPDNPFIFTTAGFWIFLLLILAGYSLVYRKINIRNTYLFLISLYFYFKTGGLFLFLLVFVTVIDYTCGLLISNSESRSRRKFYIALSIISNLGLLAYFKYAAFIAESANALFGTQIRVFDLLSALSNSTLGTAFDTSFIILPVGISFFTFQSLSYTIDVYRKKMEPVRNIIDFGFYVSFFPHLVAGPIVRASVFMPQVYQEFRLSRNEFSHALFMISRGLIKKIVISNFIAVNFIDRVFDAPALYSGFENLAAVYGYGLQIYCDFSGYTDIAIGVALVLGFRLPVNFNSPYRASSITDFWKRWHISLSRWLKDYLYISIGGNRKGGLRTYINLMITMLLGGLWHGAALRFIIWGGLHGIGLVFDRIRQSLFGEAGKLKWLIKLAGIILTFHFVNFCWIFFRANTLNDAMIMLQQIWNNFSPGSYLTVLPAYGEVFLMILTGYILHFLPEKIKESYRGLFIKMPVMAQLTAIMIIAIFLFQLRTSEVMPFIYFRF